MKLKALTTAAFLLATTSLVQAAPIDDVLSALDTQGFVVTEVKEINGTIYIEANRDGVERELVYNAATGELLKDEVDGKVLAGSGDVDSLDEAEAAELDDEYDDDANEIEDDADSSDDSDENDDNGSDDSYDSEDDSNDDDSDESDDDESDDDESDDDESDDDESDDDESDDNV